MQSKTILKALAIASVGMLLSACNDETTSPTPQVAVPSSPAAAVETDPMLVPFVIRAPIEPFFINQAPDFMFRSHTPADLIVQRLVTSPSTGGWHTHPGPLFTIVERGRVMITRYHPKTGCTSTIYEAGDTYVEVADEVHRATVLQPDVAVEYKTRFVIPVGGLAADPVPVNQTPTCS